MLSTRTLVTDVRDVPATWVFENFCGLQERLTGAEVKIRSVFKPTETKPSMYIFFSTELNKWWFHDFSTGKSGDCIKLVRELELQKGRPCSYAQACMIIRTAFTQFLRTNTYAAAEFKPATKYRVTDYAIRGWNVLDAKYWTPYNIGSALLEEYFVRPLEFYRMTNENVPTDFFKIQGEHIYGYFTPDGILYKIYCPKRERKFIKVMDYIQGIDQLKDRKCLIVASSLKDGLSLRSLNLDVDFVAPDSENTILPELMIWELYDRYEGRMFTLLDNDEAGIRAMKQYRDKYQLSPILLPLAKDLSDSVETYRTGKVKRLLIPKINKLLNVV